MIDPDFDAWGCALAGVTLVEASAGTGKTYNLEQLYLRLVIERGLPVRQILVITFTRTATAELRERIRRLLLAAREQIGVPGRDGSGLDSNAAGEGIDRVGGSNPVERTARRQRLDEAIATFDEAAIMTIHGFCQRALAEQPFAAATPLSIDPAHDDRELKEQVLRDFWRRLLASGELPRVFLESLLEAGDPLLESAQWVDWRLAKPLVRLIAPPERQAPPDQDPDTLEAEARARFEDLCALAQSGLDDACAWLLNPAHGVRPRQQQRWLSARLEALRSHIAQPQAWRREPDEKVRKLDPRNLSLDAKAQTAPVAWPEPLTRLRDWLEALERLQNVIGKLHRQIRYRLLTGVPEALRAAKARQRIVSFDDMLTNLYRRLADPAFVGLARELASRYPAALVDEFQDTDPLQWEILKAIYGQSQLAQTPGSPDRDRPRVLVLVGDPKQSIYRFRNADLGVYLQARSRANHRYTLLANYRSSPGLIHAVNALFARNPQVFAQPGLVFSPARPARPEPSDTWALGPPALQLWMLGERPEGQPGEWLTRPEAIEASLQATCQEIVRLLAGAAAGTVRVGDRPLAPRDLMVLVLSHQQGRRMRTLLSQARVASVERSQQSVLESDEAEALAQVLAAILRPMDQGLVRRALSSTLMGYDAAGIAALAHDDAQAAALIERFSFYRERWQTRGFSAMLRVLMDDAQLAQRWLSQPDGERRLTNLRHLQEILQASAQQSETPAGLLATFERERREAAAGKRPDERLLRLETDADRVQILTVHSAKGLASPVVFCPTLFAASGRPDTGPETEVLRAPDTEPVLDLSRPQDPEAAQRSGVRLAMERSAEMLRLIYVALTRAQHRCYLTVGPYLSGRSPKPFQRGALNWCVAGSGHEAADWFTGADPLCSVPDLQRHWQRFARENAPHVGLSPLPQPGAGVHLEHPPADRSRIEALAAPRSVSRTWQRTSYSHLVRGAAHERSAIDHDHPRAEIGPRPERASNPDDLLDFPAGATAGECIHAVFEASTFDDPGTWPAAVAHGLRRHKEPRWTGAPHEPKLARMLEHVLSCPLPAGFRLSDLGQRECQVEWSFTLHCPSIDPPALSRCLRDHGYDAPELSARSIQGYLQGFVDLIFRHQGRFYIVDWKSNHLGHESGNYQPARLAESMSRESYTLQYLLYTVALDTYLRNRMAGQYCYEAHFGEVMYLYVRGIRPDWRDETGQPCGIFRNRPPHALIEALRRQLLAP